MRDWCGDRFDAELGDVPRGLVGNRAERDFGDDGCGLCRFSAGYGAMKLPWISRSSHEEMMGLVKQQLVAVVEERRAMLDRLATLGLGGPLFRSVEVEEPTALLLQRNL